MGPKHGITGYPRHFPDAAEGTGALHTRNSRGLGEFCASLEERTGMNILDLAGANQATITFVTNYGHSLYSDDLLLQLDAYFAGDWEKQTIPAYIDEFLERTLNFPDQTFDGALLWDSLQYLAAPLLAQVVERLRRMMSPGSCLLAFFHANEQAQQAPSYSYRVADHRTVAMLPRGMRTLSQPFNNRALEKMFQDFHSVKFFLTRDNLREVIVRR